MRTTLIATLASPQVNAYTSSVGVGGLVLSPLEKPSHSAEGSFFLAAAALSSFMMPVWEFLHVGARLTDAAAIYITLCYDYI